MPKKSETVSRPERRKAQRRLEDAKLRAEVSQLRQQIAELVLELARANAELDAILTTESGTLVRWPK